MNNGRIVVRLFARQVCGYSFRKVIDIALLGKTITRQRDLGIGRNVARDNVQVVAQGLEQGYGQPLVVTRDAEKPGIALHRTERIAADEPRKHDIRLFRLFHQLLRVSALVIGATGNRQLVLLLQFGGEFRVCGNQVVEALFLDKAPAGKDILLRFQAKVRQGNQLVFRGIGTDFNPVADKHRAVRLVHLFQEVLDVGADDDYPVRELCTQPLTRLQGELRELAPLGTHVVLPVVRVDNLSARHPEKRGEHRRANRMDVHNVWAHLADCTPAAQRMRDGFKTGLVAAL